MENNKLLEAVVDIAYYAGDKGYYSGDSRADVIDFIWWAKDFENFHKNTDWGKLDYMLTIESCVETRLTTVKIV